MVRMGWRKALTIILMGTTLPILQAHAFKPQAAAIVVDAANGRVIHADAADAITYPASLTKMMTLLLMFEAMDDKHINFNTLMRTSSRAANQAPSKLGLKVGEHINVYDAMLALIIKSANDVAVVVAEYLGGSESAFAQLMTAKAQELGMKHTTFFNASGLPNKLQRTTARDMAKLGLALYKKYPHYYKYFKTSSFHYKGQVIKGHNKLLKKYPGCDGMKTGFINASGFNLVSSAKRYGRRYIVAVLGGETSKARDNRSIELLNLAFDDHSAPNFHGQTQKPVFAELQNETKSALAMESNNQSMDQLVQQVHHSTNVKTVVPQQSLQNFATHQNVDQPHSKNIQGKQQVSTGVSPLITHAAYLPRSESTWSVQVGSYTNSKIAERKATQRINQLRLPFSPKVNIAAIQKSRKKTQYRVRLAGFTQKQANSTCTKLQNQGKACVVVRPHRNNKIYTAMNS